MLLYIHSQTRKTLTMVGYNDSNIYTARAVSAIITTAIATLLSLTFISCCLHCNSHRSGREIFVKHSE